MALSKNLPLNKVSRSNNTFNLALVFLGFFDKKRKNQLVYLIFLVILVSILEVASIGILIPFLSLLINPETFMNSHYLKSISNVTKLYSKDDFLFLVTFLFIVLVIFSGISKLLLLNFKTKLSHAMGSDLSLKIYSKLLFQTYSFYSDRNSGDFISDIRFKSNSMVINIILPFLHIFSSVIIVFSIVVMLLVLSPFVTVLCFSFFILLYYFISLFTRQKLKKNSIIINSELSGVVKVLQESFGGMKDIIINSNQLYYINLYRKSDQRLRKAEASNNVISYSPRYILEMLVMLGIAIVAYWHTKKFEGTSSIIPLLGLFVISAQKTLPFVQQIYGSWASMKSAHTSLVDVIELLNAKSSQEYFKNDNLKPLIFNHNIKLHNVYYRHSSDLPYFIRSINLEIKKGSKVGFIGATGCGKTTLMNIIMFLIYPQIGSISVDSKKINKKNQMSWHKLISHVPQDIFLADASIAENIAFGVPHESIDFDRVLDCAKQSELHNFIDGLPEKYQAKVGERGVKLSGGQKQRIGIARALYKKSEILIFDEATSSLDIKTETTVMKQIENLDKHMTIIIIAHRLSTLKKCDQIVEMKDGVITNIGSYQEIVLKRENIKNV